MVKNGESGGGVKSLEEIIATLKQDNKAVQVETEKAAKNLASQEDYEKEMSKIATQAASEENLGFVNGVLDKAKAILNKGKKDNLKPLTPEGAKFVDDSLSVKKSKEQPGYLKKAFDLSSNYTQSVIDQQPLSPENKTKALEIGNVAVDSYVAKVAEDKKLRLPAKIEKLKVAVSMFVDHVKDFATNKIKKEEFVERVKDNWAVADTMVMAGKGVRRVEQNKQSQR